MFNVAFIAEVHCTNKDTYIFSTEIISKSRKPNEKKYCIEPFSSLLGLILDLFMALVVKFAFRISNKNEKMAQWFKMVTGPPKRLLVFF